MNEGLCNCCSLMESGCLVEVVTNKDRNECTLISCFVYVFMCKQACVQMNVKVRG